MNGQRRQNYFSFTFGTDFPTCLARAIALRAEAPDND